MQVATVDGQRFARLIFVVLGPSKFSRKYFRIALAINAHYLVPLKRGAYVHGKTFMVLQKTVKNAKV